MIRVLLFGSGRMGTAVRELIEASDDMMLAGVIDVGDLEDLKTLGNVGDLIIDFSHPAMLPAMVEYAARTKTPVLSGTSGLSAQDQQLLNELSEHVAVLHSSNFSFGIAVMKHILEDIRTVMEDFDIEIVETHHNQKIDAPSGTARLLLHALDPDGRREKVYGREGFCGKRKPGEIGVHALRGGTVAGDHTVYFFGENEELSITHRATDRRIFAQGAMRAARKMVSLPAGLYQFSDILFGC